MPFPHRDPDNELRLLHWNIHSWRDDAGASNLESVVSLVQATDPHVVSLVEVDESWEHPPELDEVANHCGYVPIFVPTFEFGKDAPAGGFGNALLSKLPILAVQQRQLTWPPRLFDGSEPSEPRSVEFAKLKTATGHIWIGSTHLPRSETDTRTEATQQLAVIVRELSGPWLLLGDFNMPASVWLAAHPFLRSYPTPAEPTYPSKEPIEPIDYCVAPQELPVQAEVLPETGSDHLPLLAGCWPVYGRRADPGTDLGAPDLAAGPVTSAEFDTLFDSFTSTVFRLETLPAYAVGGAEDARLRAFREGLPRPERSVRTSPWLARIAASTAAGKTWSRVRIVDQPLTEYQRCQLESYRESQAVGEQIGLVARDAAGKMDVDFWLFDAGTPSAHAVLMHYHPDGRLDRREVVTDSDAVTALDARRRAVEKIAVPLNAFLASAERD
ncbi:MAG: endonuclease/exonuclease/phosphatase family protein [Actinomycetota bacterium]|nr:endonuclease/exonuclease/phosphatase family protein [Actinomycetota bacterium]